MKDSWQEHIDQFIKRRVEHADVQFREEHWVKMKELLDHEMPAGSSADAGKYYYLSNAITIAVGALMILALLNGAAKGTREVELRQENTTETVTDPSPNASNDLKSMTNTDTAGQSDHSKNINPPVDVNSARIKDPIAGTGSKKPAFSVSERSVSIVPEEDKNTVAGESIDRESDRENLPISSAKGPEPSKAVVFLEGNEEGIYYMILVEGKGFPPVDASLTIGPLRENPYEMELIAGNEKNQSGGSSYFSVGPVIAPDFNSVGFARRQKISAQGGIVVEFIFKDQWIISSGIMVNKKRYITDGENFNPPTGYWRNRTNGVIPDEIDGHCTVMDIPLSVGFNWNPASRFQLLTKVGINNYFLTEEAYVFLFSTPNPGADSNWSSNDNSKIVAGVANFSLGVQWQVRPRITLRVEPYLKVPFKGVGWGSLDLFSSGSLIGLFYQISNKPKDKF